MCSALELILLEFKTKSFVPLVVSSVTATVITHLFIGQELAYPISGIAEIYILRSPYELLLYLLLGLLAGVLALFFIKFFYRIEEFFQSIKIKDFVKPMIGGLLVGLIGLMAFEIFGGYFIFGTGYGSIMPALLSENVSGDLMYAGAKLALFMLLLMFLKMLATSLTLGSGGSGGLFAPSLWIGGMMGAAFGVVANIAFPGIAAPFGAYALVGMAAFFAGTSRAVLTSIIILFEMTSTYEIILPLMFACVVAVAVSRVMSRGTLYTYGMEKMGIHYSPDREVNILETTEVNGVMSCKVETVNGNMTLGEVIEKILATGHRGFPCLDENGKLCGIITYSDVQDAVRKGTDRNVQIHAILNICPPETAFPDEQLQSVLERMAEKDFGYIPVVERGDTRKLAGIITRKDIIQVYQMRSKDTKDKEDYWK